MTLRRRTWLTAAACVAALDNNAKAAPSISATTDRPLMLDDSMIDAEAPRLDPVPVLPVTPTPGRPGDFAFLDGKWRIRHLKRRGDIWHRFDGEARCWSILGGVGSVEELLIQARDFSGLGLRMLDVAKRRWFDHWSGGVTTPGKAGSFENGAGSRSFDPGSRVHAV